MGICCKNIFGAAVLVGVTAAVTTQVVSQQVDEAAAEHMQMMEAWMKLAQPGEQHAEMAKMVGNWKQESKHWPYPGAQPEVTEGTATYKSIMGGRFVMQNVQSEFEMEGQVMKMDGLGIHGYDNIKQKYIFAWLDNFGTMIMTGEGDLQEDGSIVFWSEFPGPDGEMMKMKSVQRTLSDDAYTFEMWSEHEGEWHKGMMMNATRQ